MDAAVRADEKDVHGRAASMIPQAADEGKAGWEKPLS
jgi:hypothetical protein